MMIEPAFRAPLPPGLNRTVWAATIVAALIPIIHWWQVDRDRGPIEADRTEIAEYLEEAQIPERRPRSHLVPDSWT